MTQTRLDARVRELQSQGCHLHQFGRATLGPGSFGPDVAALQMFLSERSYFNAGKLAAVACVPGAC